MKKNIFFPVFIVLLALFVMGPSFFDGKILSLLDYAFVPHQSIDFTLPLGQILMHTTSFIFGAAFGSKIFFLAILIASGFLGFLMSLAIEKQYSLQSHALRIFGILFFMMNPFAYERMMTQPQLYLGIIFLGYGIYFLLFSSQSYREKYIFSALSFGLSLSLFPHAFYMIVCIYTLFLSFFIRSWKMLMTIIISGVIIIFLNLNWLFFQFSGIHNTLSGITLSSSANLDAFSSRAIAPLGPTLTNILLYGFWGETSHFALPSYANTYWFFWGFLLLSIMLSGAVLLFGKKSTKREFYFLSILGLLSLALGIGIASEWSRSIIELFYTHLPYFSGYREPQKWIGLLMFVEGVFFLTALAWILKKIKDIYLISLFLGLLLLSFFFWNPGMIWGFRGQLVTMTYPSSFEAFRNEMLSRGKNAKILVLPWHSYMACDWTEGKVIANSMNTYFTPVSATIADNIEIIGKLYSNSQSKESKVIEEFLSKKGKNKDDFYSLGYTDIFIMKTCASLDSFSWISDEGLCKKEENADKYIRYSCR